MDFSNNVSLGLRIASRREARETCADDVDSADFVELGKFHLRKIVT